MSGLIPYVGGKSRLAPTLIELFPKHRTYVEPFCGGAHVFFTKPASRVEVLNDLDGELVTFLRVCQQHHGELLRHIACMPQSRGWRDLHARQDPRLLTDIQRAARFYYLQRTAWGSKVQGQRYCPFVTGGSRLGRASIRQNIKAAAQRLATTQIENLPYDQVLSRYDGPGTFFYLDPPYVGLPYYNFNLTDEEYETLATRLAAIKGRFLLSINDHPVSRAAFRAFEMRRVPVTYTVSSRSTYCRELLIANYPLVNP